MRLAGRGVMTMYLDHAATTPVDPRVVEMMLPLFSGGFGNPSSIYGLGQDAARAIDTARDQVAAALNARNADIVFTGGGTDSDNIALRGAAYALRSTGNHIVTTAIEHHAIIHTCEWLERFGGFDVTYLTPDEEGAITALQVAEAITPATTLVSVMYANNETGTIQPIADIAARVRDAEKSHGHRIVFHTDAVQAAGWLSLDVQALGVDMLSLSAHKFHGPKGVGVLFLDRDAPFQAQTMGGSQERNRRAGTENTAGIVGTGYALHLAEQGRAEIMPRVARLAERLCEGIQSSIPGVAINGPPIGDPCRLANNVNVSFSGVEIESVLINLDIAGIAASSGSACTSGSIDPSHVLAAMGKSPEMARNSLRLTLGRDNTQEEIEGVLQILPDIIGRVRELNAPRRGR